MAEAIDSPLAVTRADSAPPGRVYSRDVGREVSFLHGPGESPDINGEGRGVTSAIALSIGDDMAEFGPELRYEFVLALVRVFLILGVRGGGMPIRLGGRLLYSPDFRAEETLLSEAGVIEHPGMISVCNLESALKGLGCMIRGESGRWGMEEVFSSESAVGSCDFVEIKGGDGALVVDLKATASLGTDAGRPAFCSTPWLFSSVLELCDSADPLSGAGTLSLNGTSVLCG